MIHADESIKELLLVRCSCEHMEMINPRNERYFGDPLPRPCNLCLRGLKKLSGEVK